MLGDEKGWIVLVHQHTDPRSGQSVALRGFSLIEMMIVIAIVGVLATLTVPSFFDWIERSKVRAATEGIHSGVQLARIEALSRNARVRFNLANDRSWTVTCVGGELLASGCTTAGEVLHRKAGGEGAGSYLMTVTPSTGTMIEFTPSGRTNTAITPADRITEIEFAATNANANVVNSKLRIQVNNFGKTRTCEPYAASGSATAC